MSSIAVPDVNPRTCRFNTENFWSVDEEGDVEREDSPFAFACNASRYLCPTGVLTRPFGAGMRPFMTITIAIDFG